MERAERVLRTLFDFQRFAGDARLERVICSAGETDGCIPLEDSELEVNAAGDADDWRARTGGKKEP